MIDIHRHACHQIFITFGIKERRLKVKSIQDNGKQNYHEIIPLSIQMIEYAEI